MSKKSFSIPILSLIFTPRRMAWLDALSNRERIILFVSAVSMIYLVWNTFFFKPTKANINKLQGQIRHTQDEIGKINQEVVDLISKLEQSSGEKNQDLTTRARLIERAKILDEKLGILTSDLVSSNQMVTALRAMLERQQGLRLVSLDTIPAKQIDSSEELSDSLTGVYKHEIHIVLLGDYFSVLNYLKSLESLGWRLFWDSMEYKVIAYPTAQVTIKLHTLSTQKGFN